MIEGWIDNVAGGQVVGWVWRRDAPDERLMVVVSLDGVDVASGLADRYRADLDRTGIGDGRHGYTLSLPAALTGSMHALAVRVDGEGTYLPASSDFRFSAAPGDPPDLVIVPAPVEAQAPPPPPPPPAAVGPVRGYVEVIDGATVVGWAHSPSDPDRRLTVIAMLDGVEVSRGVADRDRLDLRRAGIGDGHYEFSLQLGIDPVSAASVDVVVAETGDTLVRSADFVHRGASTGRPPEATPAPAPISSAHPQDVTVPSASIPEPGASPPAVSGATVPGRLVVVAEDDWCFTVDDLQDLLRLTGAQAVRMPAVAALADTLVAERRAAVGRGMRHVIAVVPAKSSVYRDRLPIEIPRALPATPGELLLTALQDRAGLHVVDLRSALVRDRRHGRVYLRTQDALSWLGAHRASRALVHAVGIATGRDVGLSDAVHGALAAVPTPAGTLVRWDGGALVAHPGTPAPEVEPPLVLDTAVEPTTPSVGILTDGGTDKVAAVMASAVRVSVGEAPVGSLPDGQYDCILRLLDERALGAQTSAA